VSGRGRGHGAVGRAAGRVDSLGQVTGRTIYADDLMLPRTVTAKLLRSPHAHARIVKVDTTAAAAHPGVHAVLVGTDLPIKYGILPVSQDENALAIEKVRYVGEPVAAVAAADPETADEALALIEVEYEALPDVTSIEEALDPSHPLIHGEGTGANVDRETSLEFGDVKEGFAQADHIQEDTYFFQGNTHAALEPHATVASMGDDGRLTVWSSTQVPHYLHRILAKVLELPAGQIRVIATAVGGGFGGKTDIFSHEIVAARLARTVGRPVKITLTREDVFYAHRGRHPVLMKVRTGFTTEGRITAMSFRSYLDGGAYGSYGAASLLYTGQLQTTTYSIPRYQFQGVRVFTNKPPCGPKRGHGTPQGRFAIEAHLDRAAEALGIDPVALRRRNLVEPFSHTVNHLRITSCGLAECLDRVTEASSFDDKHTSLPAGRGIGVAVGAYLSGAGFPIYFNDMPQSEVMLKVDRGGGVTVFSMAADCGQGSTTMLATVVAEVLGLEPGDLSVVTADTDLTPIDLGSYSSRVTFMAGNAALEAAQRLLEEVLEAVAAELGVDTDLLSAEDGSIIVDDNPDKGVTWTEAVQLAMAQSGALVTSGSYKTPEGISGRYRGAGVGPTPAYSYTACVAEVTCDPDTGFVTVDQVWLAHDIGKALNPLLAEGQIEGSVHMALGEVLMEEQAFLRNGLHRGPSLLDYKIPTILEMPPVESFIIETDDPEGPFGAKEVGQGALLPVIPAVVNAVHDALGIRIDETPVRPDTVVTALADLAKGGSGRVGPTSLPDHEFPPLYRVEPPANSPGAAS